MAEKWIKVTRVLEYFGPETWVRATLAKSAVSPEKPQFMGNSVIRETDRQEMEIEAPGPHGTFVLCDKCKIGFLNRKYCVGSYGSAKCCLGQIQPSDAHYDVWCPVCGMTRKEML